MTVKENLRDLRNTSEGPELNILDKIEVIAQQQPGATTFELEEEATAGQLLLALAALISGWTDTDSIKADKEDRGWLRKRCQEYRKAAIRGMALQFIHDLEHDDRIEIAGLLMTAKLPTIQ